MRAYLSAEVPVECVSVVVHHGLRPVDGDEGSTVAGSSVTPCVVGGTSVVEGGAACLEWHSDPLSLEPTQQYYKQ